MGTWRWPGAFPRDRRELPDSAEIFPTHGFGSFCAASQAQASSSTIGREKRANPALTVGERHYVETLPAGPDVWPAYYAHMGPANTAGPAGPDLTPPRRAAAAEIRRRIDAGEWVVDLRDRVAFAAGFVPGSFGFSLDGSFATYLGWLISLPRVAAVHCRGADGRRLGALPDGLSLHGGRLNARGARPWRHQH
ncbi:MAG: hypothetical protein ACM3ML_36795 [Micromonosporaceae bacterium]